MKNIHRYGKTLPLVLDGVNDVKLPPWMISASGNDPYVDAQARFGLVGFCSTNLSMVVDEVLIPSARVCDLVRLDFFLFDVLPKDIVGAFNRGVPPSTAGERVPA